MSDAAHEPGIGPLGKIHQWLLSAGKMAVAASVAGALLLGQPAARADEIVRYPASADPQILAAQQTLLEAWSIISDSYVDGNFNNRDWESELSKHLMAAYNADNGDAAYKEIGDMLEGLGDPFTRIIPAEEYAEFRVSSDGELQGVGLIIALEPSSGRLLVLAPLKGGPADRAGVLPGDEVLSINGQSTKGWDGNRAAKYLRGKDGSLVKVKLARRTDQIPGVPGTPEPVPTVQYKEINLKREVVELSPVYSQTIADGDHTFGYIRLSNFSSKAANDISKAIEELENSGVDSYILDLRDNPGGLVQAGLDVARVWLDGAPTIFNVSGRVKEVAREVVLDNGLAITERPLVVLVNKESASASEILAGALHDNHRADIVGEKTFGKGKIQTVFELQDGSALFVTVAKYQTPAHNEIDKIGIRPDKACAPDPLRRKRSLKQASADNTLIEAGAIIDDCVLTAERILERKVQG